LRPWHTRVFLFDRSVCLLFFPRSQERALLPLNTLIRLFSQSYPAPNSLCREVRGFTLLILMSHLCCSAYLSTAAFPRFGWQSLQSDLLSEQEFFFVQSFYSQLKVPTAFLPIFLAVLRLYHFLAFNLRTVTSTFHA